MSAELASLWQRAPGVILSPSEDESAGVQLLESRRLLTVEPRQFVVCGEVEGSDHRYTRCDEPLILTEGAERVICPVCETDHWGEDLVPKPALVCRLDEGGIQDWLADELHENRRIGEHWAWQVFGDDHDVWVVLLDEVKGTRFETPAFLQSHCVLLLVIQASLFEGQVPEAIPRLTVGEIIANPSSLKQQLQGLVTKEFIPPAGDLSLPALAKPWVEVQQGGALVLRRVEAGYTLEGVLVLSAAHQKSVRMLDWLVQRWREDVGDGKASDSHCTFLAEEVAFDLGLTGGNARKQMFRLRRQIGERFREIKGWDLGVNDVIEHVTRQGFRLSSSRVLVVS